MLPEPVRAAQGAGCAVRGRARRAPPRRCPTASSASTRAGAARLLGSSAISPSTASATSATSIVSFLLLPVYVRYLTPEDYGVISLLLTVEVVSKIVFRWGVDASFMRLYYDCPDHASRQRLASTIFWFLAARERHAARAGPARGARGCRTHLFGTDRYATVLRLDAGQHVRRRLLLHPVPRPAHQGPIAAVHRADVLALGRDAAAPPAARRRARSWACSASCSPTSW